MELTTDYLVVGAGASGLAFTDTLIAESDADVLIVDRRAEPGGHWCDTYPFVRMHGPSVIYGVGSLPLGSHRKQVGGDNDGFYEQATGAQVQEYFREVLGSVLEPSGQVRFRGRHEYVGGSGCLHVIRDLATGVEHQVRVRRSMVDATYLEGDIPATHTPAFAVAPEVAFCPINDLPERAADHPTFTVIGGGKTAVDACMWLLDRGTDPERIRWIRPREAWFGDRATTQPLDLIGPSVRMMSVAAEIIATGGEPDTMLARFEEAGQLMRLDPAAVPTMYRGTFLSRAELGRLRSITDVVRLGRVRSIAAGRLVLDEGEMASRPGTLLVDCSGYGIRRRGPVPVFGLDRITLQYVRDLLPSFNAALIAWVETNRTGEGEKNRLCPPNLIPSRPHDWAPMLVRTWLAMGAWRTEPDLQEWIDASRLNLAVGPQMRDDPVVRESLDRFRRYARPAIERVLLRA